MLGWRMKSWYSTVLVLDWRAWQHNYSFGREIGESNQLLSEVTNPNNPYPIHALLRASLPAERSPQAERTHRRHPLPKLSLEEMETERVLGFDDACGLQSPVVLPHALDLQHGTPSAGQARASLGHRQPTRSPAAGQRSRRGAAHRRRTEQATTSHDTRCDTCSGTALARK